MQFTFLNIFDQFRFMGGTLTADFLLTDGGSPRKAYFVPRAAGCAAFCLLLSLLYIPMTWFEDSLPWLFYPVAAVWWFALSVLGVGCICFCYRIRLADALFRASLAGVLQNIPTVLLRFLFVGILFPEFEAAHPVWYVVLAIAVYVVVYGLFDLLKIRKISLVYSVAGDGSVSAIVTQAVIFVSLSVISESTTSVFYLFDEGDADETDILLVKIFCVALHIFICLIVFVLQYGNYHTRMVEREKEIDERVLSERERQYRLSRSSVEIIKRQSHDLKHQISALLAADKAERAAALKEVQDTLSKYDSIVWSGNEALNTILTEKALLCSQKGIRFSCTCGTADTGSVNILDLYTLLGNLLDNAVESAEKLEDPEKKIVSCSVARQANLLCVSTENYFAGKISFRDGLPQTTKEEKELHGQGMRSIRMIAEKYGGDLRIRADGDLFCVQAVLAVY